MKRTHVPFLTARRQRRLAALAAPVIAFAMVLAALGVAPAAAQNATPSAQAPQQNAAPAAQTPTAASSSNQAASTDPLSPGAVIAQGLVYLDGSTQAWAVIQQKPPALSSAQSAVANTAFLFQRGGATMIRNDVTGKRARLEASEAYYESAGDPYTVWADSSSATLWNFQLVPPANVAKEAFYESPEIKGISEGTYDLELTRFILQPGDSVQLPESNGAGLIMPFAGQVNVSISGSAGVLSEGDGQLVSGNGTANNQGNQTAGFVFAALGEKVSDQQPGNAPAQPAATTAPNATTTSNAPNAGTTPNAAGTTAAVPATEAAAPQGTVAATQTGTVDRTSIAVTAQADIYVEVSADGVLMFQGNLATGQTTGQIAGASFTVYTSSGVNTLFTNSCGTDFYMGNEEGEATYYLSVGPESCPPSV